MNEKILITSISRKQIYERTKKLFNILMVFTDRGYLGTKNKGLLLKDKNIQFICFDERNYYLYVKLNNEQKMIFLINDDFVFIIEKDFLRKEEIRKEYEYFNIINEIIEEL